MTDTTPLDTDAIAARAEAATPGPWTMWNPSEGPSHLTMENKIVWESKRSASEYGDDEKIPHWCDANFIAHARTDIPELLAEVKRLRSDLADAEMTLTELQPDPVLVEDSWIPVAELPTVLGNFMRTSAELGREVKRQAGLLDRVDAAYMRRCATTVDEFTEGEEMFLAGLSEILNDDKEQGK